MDDTVRIFEIPEPEINVQTGLDSALSIHGQDAVITVYEPQTIPELDISAPIISSISIFGEESVVIVREPGARGATGEQGPAGYSGAGEPFFVVQSGSMYATTASIAINAFISSSLIPWSSSFNVGSTSYAWQNAYFTGSIFIISGSSTLVQINKDKIEIGDTRITSASYNFGTTEIIKRISNNQQAFVINSGSVSSSFNETGIFIVSEFDYTPEAFSGGIMKSGSSFYFGI